MKAATAELVPILVADDQVDIRRALRLLLKDEGFDVHEASSPSEVMAALSRRSFDVVLLDLNYARDTTSGREGLDLLPRIVASDPHLSAVVLTAWGTIPSAVAAMRYGARDYVEKPWDNDRLLGIVRAAAEITRARRRSLAQAEPMPSRDAAPDFITMGPAMRRVRELLDRIAPSDASVLVTGEHGTGKEVVARWIHARSRRQEKPLVTLNAGGLADGVFESECFGHVRGAFTDAKSDRVGCFEQAEGGTLFLDEIGNMPLSQQAKLLRVLETGEFQRVGSPKLLRADVRVISATNADLARAVEEGRFRADLLYRLNTVEIPLPPLRERGEDLKVLAERFLGRFAQRYGREEVVFTEAALRALSDHDWPGNVRELAHVVERAVLLAKGREIEVDCLMLGPRSSPTPSAPESNGLLSLGEAERRLVEQAIERTGGNVTQAAQILGVSRSALYRRIEQLRKKK